MQGEILGRDSELRLLGEFLADLPRAPRALALSGAAGAGKTTLLQAGAALARKHGHTVLEAMPSHSDLRLAFAGLTDLLEPRIGAVLDRLPPPQRRALGVALLLQDAPAQPPEPRVIAAAFRTTLLLLADAAPVLVVIDDTQWLDPPTEAAVSFAFRRLASEPVGLLCARRDARAARNLPFELDRGRMRADVLPLGGLSPGALHKMLRTRLDVSFSLAALRRIAAESGGNPFIALEIGRALARRGIYRVGTGPLPVPDTLGGLVDERLRELSPGVLDALRVVAVMPGAPIGRYLAAGADGKDLDTAALAGVLESSEGRLRFSHPLLSSAVAASIPPVRVRELHTMAARSARSPEERARHGALAADGPSAALAAELDAAAGLATSRGAPASAAELFELAASLTPGDRPGDARRRLLNAAGQLALAGETHAATASFERLIASMQPGPERAAALNQLGWLRQDDIPASTLLQEQALAEARDNPSLTADIHFALSDNWSAQGDYPRALAEARRALAEAEQAGDPALLASSLAQVVLFASIAGQDLDEHQLQRSLELERTVSSLLLRTPPSWVAGYCHLAQGRLEEAEAELQQALARSEADGVEYWRADTLLRLAAVAERRGDATEAAERAARGLDIAEQLDLPQLISALLYGCARAALQLGQAELVRDLAQRGMDVAGRIGDRPYLFSHQALLGSLELALGDYLAAAARLRPLVRQWREMGVSVTGRVGPDAVEALIAVGELDDAATIVAEMERELSDPVAAPVTARCGGALAAARGDLDAALTQLTEALRLHDQISPQPLQRGRTLLVLGGVQRRLKQRAAARATLSDAIAIFDGIGAPLWAARARGELARVSGRAPGSGGLTVTELRVAELVAQGLTNRTVAAELFVTVRAVESILTKVYAKLGVQSRTQLAAHLHQGH